MPDSNLPETPEAHVGKFEFDCRRISDQVAIWLRKAQLEGIRADNDTLGIVVEAILEIWRYIPDVAEDDAEADETVDELVTE